MRIKEIVSEWSTSNLVADPYKRRIRLNSVIKKYNEAERLVDVLETLKAIQDILDEWKSDDLYSDYCKDLCKMKRNLIYVYDENLHRLTTIQEDEKKFTVA